MQPPVEINDRSQYKRRMNELLQIDKRSTVVITVDMQNDYLDMALATAPVAPEEAERVIGGARRLLDFARAEGIPVIHVYVKRRPVEVARGFESHPMVSLSQRARCSQNVHAEARRGPDRVEGMPQAEVVPSLVAPGDVHVTTKRVMDGFHGTDLDTLLARVFKAETVVLTGINTDTCVMATTFAAGNRGYRPVVISDCVASMRGIDQHWMALEMMARSIAWVMTIDEFTAKVREASPAMA